MESFDLDELRDTYVKVFYYYANEVGRDIIICERPSFSRLFDHILPYYTRNEIINIALNNNLINKEDVVDFDPINDEKQILKLCEIVSLNDITAQTLLNHYRYIINNNMTGLIQHYTLHGSYFMNEYLRDREKDGYKNEYIENLIKSIWKIIDSAPSFDKSYIVYRFISNDTFIKDLNIGDIYTEYGFMSTTRDPFYKQDAYKFGFILLKIKIPKDIKGIALCVETLSHFPYEEEIIFAPSSKFKLIAKDSDVFYNHIDSNYTLKLKTKYELEYIGKNDMIFIEKQIKVKNNIIDFLKIEKIQSYSLKTN